MIYNSLPVNHIDHCFKIVYRVAQSLAWKAAHTQHCLGLLDALIQWSCHKTVVCQSQEELGEFFRQRLEDMQQVCNSAHDGKLWIDRAEACPLSKITSCQEKVCGTHHKALRRPLLCRYLGLVYRCEGYHAMKNQLASQSWTTKALDRARATYLETEERRRQNYIGCTQISDSKGSKGQFGPVCPWQDLYKNYVRSLGLAAEAQWTASSLGCTRVSLALVI